jgi:hypothetical protein
VHEFDREAPMMWRSTPLLIAVAAALLWPASAMAKGQLTAAWLCGRDGRCVRVPANDLQRLSNLLLLVGQGTLHRPPALQGFARVRARAEFNADTPTISVVPAAGLLESGGSWVALPPRIARDVRRLASRIMLFMPQHVQVSADGTAVTDKRAAATLLGPLPAARPPNSIWESRIVQLSFDSRPASPWSDSPAILLDYFPRYSLLELPGFQWRRVPAKLDGRLRRAAGWTTPPVPHEAGESAHLPIVTIAAVVLLGVLVVAEAGRRRRPGRPRSV